MKVEKEGLTIGLMTGIIVGLVLGLVVVTILDMARDNSRYEDYIKGLEFREAVRAEIMYHNPSMDIDASDYLFETRINGQDYLVWVELNEPKYFNYNYARLGE